MKETWMINFVVIGASRAGTTTLYKYMQRHPHICMSTPKEPGHFAFHKEWRENLDVYHNLFSPKDGQLCGDASTMYTWFPDYPHTAKGLYEYNPDIKIIYLVRNPVARILSQYSMWLVRGVIKNDPNELIKNPAFVNRSRYWLQLRQYLDYFPKSNFHIVISEELFANPNDKLKDTFKFLGLTDDGFLPNVFWENPSIEQTLELWHFKSLSGEVGFAG